MYIQDGQYPAILAECWSITHNYLEQQLELCEGLFQNSVLHFFTKALWLYILFFERLKLCLGVNWVSEIRELSFSLVWALEFFCICFQEITILSWFLWSVLVLIISNKNIQKLKLTKNITDWDLKISQVEELQFCCSAGICKNK